MYVPSAWSDPAGWLACGWLRFYFSLFPFSLSVSDPGLHLLSPLGCLFGLGLGDPLFLISQVRSPSPCHVHGSILYIYIHIYIYLQTYIYTYITTTYVHTYIRTYMIPTYLQHVIPYRTGARTYQKQRERDRHRRRSSKAVCTYVGRYHY
ncbi:hypothetical protein F4813DRAFT_99399 [Daldinia decipiens]|uniref:uncharacterized protein n=1 Tax=Daldinia decipiens TaxID=326647 RepID=UPI0020C26355|nr:uncharacterized protein F4813DRAFT_99399 [Daldinia decipiens]KAI1662134.1 hypothetical protein F4813DRAFT_99399 [Daldinia decipiens]